MRFQLYAWFFVFFALSQMLGILVALALMQQGVHATIVNDNPQDPINSFALLLYIIFVTAFFLFLMRFFKRRAFGLFEKIAVFFTTWLVLDSLIFLFFPQGPALVLFLSPAFAILLVVLRIKFRKNIWLKNISSLFAVAGAGALIGVSLGVLPVIIFIVSLSVYDIFAVFVTKHMVKMAKAIVSENLAFTFTIPTKEREFQLGTGDLVIPLVFGIAVFSTTASKLENLPLFFAIIPVLLVLFASILGLVGTLHICAERKIALPALPLQSVFMIAMWGACLFAGMPVL
ncbi:MAG: presenilin family intramembrane aspartyl protease [Candidatus Diapherotrites archaeon]